MNHTTPARRLASLFLILSLLIAPVAVLAKKGDKNYKRGLEHEKMEQWEQAAQEYALAIATNPSDMEFQLHYRRALFNASQKFMDQGRALAEQGDYAGAYNAFRQAYGYDPVNDLAVAEMNRMLRLQREKEGATGTTTKSSATSGALNVPTSFDRTNGVASPQGGRIAADGQQPPLSATEARNQQLRVINFSGDLEDFVRQLATELGLNVIFDRDFPKRTIKVNLRDVTAARALDDIFVAQNLFFQKLDRRTVLVADQSKRGQYQQLVLRTFYLVNIDPADARNLIQSALPPNAGRQPLVTPNKVTNSITVRDTPENIRLIEQLLRTIDKDRAEVVMDVNIYEVSRTNLLQLGNQFGDATSLGNVGGLLASTFPFGGGQSRITGVTTGGGGTKGGGTTTKDVTAAAAALIPNVVGGAFVLPATSLSAFQSKDRTRLLAHTQVHAFDGEQSTTRIGQKVPVQTAQVTPFGNVGTGTAATGTAAGANSIFGSGGYPVIQYQDTGLNLKFTPQVFPNQDVEVKMEIESNDVIGGPTSLTPTFSQRTMSGKARIPNGRTVMIASVAQDKQSHGTQGLPILGLIPILGRLFATPTSNDSNADIVITVTPRVLSAPFVTPEDIEVHPSGTLQAPISDTLEAMVRDADREDNLAAARQLPTNANVQLPTTAANDATKTADATAAATQTQTASAQTPQTSQTLAPPTQIADANTPAYVPAPKLLAGATPASASSTVGVATSFAPSSSQPVATNAVLKTAGAMPIINTDDPPPPAPSAKGAIPAATTTTTTTKPTATTTASVDGAQLFVMPGRREMRVGERQRLMIFVKTSAPLALAAATLKFDPRVFAVRSIERGSIFGEASSSQPTITQSIDQRGTLLAVVAPQSGSPLSGAGVLLFVEIEALAVGESEITFDATGVHLMSLDGRNVAAQTSPVRLTVKQ
jgi:general secretion pathway protein D